MKLLVLLFLSLAVIVAISECRAPLRNSRMIRSAEKVENSSDDDDEDIPVDWYKNLNNLLSVGAHNLLVSGEFLALYPFSSLARLPEKNTCNRELHFDPTSPEKFKNPLKKIYNSGYIKIGVASVLSLPYYSNSTGSPTGFFFDLANSLANEISFILRRTIKAKFVTFYASPFFDGALSVLANNTVDTIIGMSYLVSRTPFIDYSCWYETPSPFAVYRDTTRPLPTGFPQPTTLSGWNSNQIKVATLIGTIFETAARKYLPNAQFFGFPTMNDAYNATGNVTDIVFSITGETEGYNEAHGLRLTVQPNTLVLFGGGNAFGTYKQL